jgi:hypothetical protein
MFTIGNLTSRMQAKYLILNLSIEVNVTIVNCKKVQLQQIKATLLYYRFLQV